MKLVLFSFFVILSIVSGCDSRSVENANTSGSSTNQGSGSGGNQSSNNPVPTPAEPIKPVANPAPVPATTVNPTAKPTVTPAPATAEPIKPAVKPAAAPVANPAPAPAAKPAPVPATTVNPVSAANNPIPAPKPTVNPVPNTGKTKKTGKNIEELVDLGKPVSIGSPQTNPPKIVIPTTVTPAPAPAAKPAPVPATAEPIKPAVKPDVVSNSTSSSEEVLKEYKSIEFYNNIIVRERFSDEQLNNILNKFEKLSFEYQNLETKNAIKTLKAEKKSRTYIKAKKDELLNKLNDFEIYLDKYNDDIFTEAKQEFFNNFDINTEKENLNKFTFRFPPVGRSIKDINDVSIRVFKDTFNKFNTAKEYFKFCAGIVITNKIFNEKIYDENLLNNLSELGSKQLLNAVEALKVRVKENDNISKSYNYLNNKLNQKKVSFNNEVNFISIYKDNLSKFVNEKDNECINIITDENKKLYEREEALDKLKFIINDKDEDYKTIVHKAAIEGNGDALKALIYIGADMYASDEDDNTPLHLAAKNAHKRATEILIDFYKKNNIKNIINNANIDRDTPLHLVATSKAANLFEIENIIKILVENGADVNSQNINGQTPLHAVVISNKNNSDAVTNIIRILLANGANVNLENIHGETALDCAKNKEIKDILTKAQNNILQ